MMTSRLGPEMTSRASATRHGDEVVHEERHDEDEAGRDDVLGVLLPEAWLGVLEARLAFLALLALHAALELLQLRLLLALLLVAAHTISLVLLLQQTHGVTSLTELIA